MGFDIIAFVIFVILLGLFVYKKRSKIEIKRLLFPVFYIIMYRSGFGLRTMDLWARRCRLFFQILGYVAIVVGYLGMVVIAFELVVATFKVFSGASAGAVQLVLPVQAKGVFFVPFLFWVLSIFIVAVVHEFAHGVIARAHKIPLKSTGFAFFSLFVPILPAAFVEPDETTLMHRRAREQLSVYAAGPVANLACAGVFLVFLALLAPVSDAVFEPAGVEIIKLEEGGPADLAGLEEGAIIVELNDFKVKSVQNLTNALNSQPTDELVVLDTLDSERFSFMPGVDPKNSSHPIMGVSVKPYIKVKTEFLESYPAWLPPIFKWFSGLFFWIFVLSLGIGLFNLLPVGPLDGGHMARVGLLCVFKDQKRAFKLWTLISLFFVAVILANIFAGLF